MKIFLIILGILLIAVPVTWGASSMMDANSQHNQRVNQALADRQAEIQRLNQRANQDIQRLNKDIGDLQKRINETVQKKNADVQRAFQDCNQKIQDSLARLRQDQADLMSRARAAQPIAPSRAPVPVPRF